MHALLRRIGVSILIVLCLTPMIVFAQDSTQDAGNADPLTVIGSGIVLPALETIAAQAGTPLTATVTGTTAGLDGFCRGEADLVAAARALSADEEVVCATSGITFTELLLGYNVLTFITAPDSTHVTCLTAEQLNTLLAPSAAGQITDWSQVNTENAAAPLTVVAPPEDTPTAALLDDAISGVGLRADAVRTADVIATVSADANALGVVSLAEAVAAGDAVRVLNVNASPAGCTAPSAEAVSADTYPVAALQYLYVRTDSLTLPGALDLLTAATSPAAAEVLAASNLTAPTEADYTLNAETLAASTAGRTFSAQAAEYGIDPAVQGTVAIGGSASLAGLIDQTTSGFSASYPGVTFTVTFDGQAAGVRSFCNGEIDLLVAFAGLTDEAQANCTVNNIRTYTLPLGYETTVLVGNAATAHLQCLTRAQIASAFNGLTLAATWDQVDAGFPATPIILFTPADGSPQVDLLLLAAGELTAPPRADLEADDDAAFRAAATANVEGALAVLTWQEYQSVLASGQQNIQVVQVDGGSGCTEPTFETIAAGAYPISRPANLIVNLAALARPEVQSALWYLLSEANYSTFLAVDLVGVTFDGLTDLRVDLQAAFAEAAAFAALPVPEATPAPEAEATAEATAESDAAAEATTEPLAEATTEPVAEATAEPTAEATP